MIELVMLFALGFLFAGLLTLLFLPAFWRRAVRLSTRRLETQMPLTMAEIVTERDQLRANFATEQRRLEQKVEDIAEQRARDLAELGRRAARIAWLDADLEETKQERGRLMTRATELGDRLSAVETEAGVLHEAQWGLLTRIENLSGETANLTDERDSLHGLAEDRRAAIAALETRVASLEVQLEDTRRHHADAERIIVERNAELTRGGAERDELRASVAGLETRAQGLEVMLEETRRRYDAAERVVIDQNIERAKIIEEFDFLRAEHASAVARRDQLQSHISTREDRISELDEAHRAERRARVRLENEIAAGVRALAESADRLKETQANSARQLDDASARERELRQQVENLRAERGALEGALEVMRREFTLLRAGSSTPAPTAARDEASAEDTRRLREDIRGFGAEVLRLATALQREAEEKIEAGEVPAPLDERVRQLKAQGEAAIASH